MAHKLCVCCGDVFVPRQQMPHQTYSSSLACQRARKRQWQREKLRTDSDYRDNQRDAQRAWLSQNPDYWRQYRRDPLDHALDIIMGAECLRCSVVVHILLDRLGRCT
ncbi:hypothetical protein [Burkholderia sp. Bp8998]|uniref:hypothetical protein n=1 Tax=Burkholderia sp. Bp8998 TaxID=2184557 RepID=UPI000F5A5998|nr:hypothetical protein [Burkholderia sp. Bp8998]RQS20724.1 hypothetical protein DIE06_09190 [Burkholderia sp. Bp8998]